MCSGERPSGRGPLLRNTAHYTSTWRVTCESDLGDQRGEEVLGRIKSKYGLTSCVNAHRLNIV